MFTIATNTQITGKSSNFDSNLKVTSVFFCLGDYANEKHENLDSANTVSAEGPDFEQLTKKVNIEDQYDNKNASNAENNEELNVDQFAFEHTLKKIKSEDQCDEIRKLNHQGFETRKLEEFFAKC